MHSLHRSMPDGVPELSGEVDTCPILQKLFPFYNCSQIKNYFVPMESHKKTHNASAMLSSEWPTQNESMAFLEFICLIMLC